VKIVIFIVFGKWRKKPTKEMVDKSREIYGQMMKEGVKFLGGYWTLGRYDMVTIAEAKDEKTLMKDLIKMGEVVSTETLVAVPNEEAHKLIE